MSEIPQHVAIIPDGNRRWARQRSMKPWEGHVKAGAFENLRPLFEEAKKQGVKYLSFWGFSTENWKRDKKEVDIIIRLILKGLIEFEENAEKERIKFVHVGRKDRLMDKLVDQMISLEEKTKNNKGLCVLLCLDYGGRDEILRAVNKVLVEGKGLGSEEEFLKFLDTKGLPDPDLIVRTGGEKRFSGFMPYQSVYSELYFTDVFFPDFNAEELRRAIEEYSRRQRRFGN
ncbi:MAG: polyprenyl diphosphate synthase [archaeon]